MNLISAQFREQHAADRCSDCGQLSSDRSAHQQRETASRGIGHVHDTVMVENTNCTRRPDLAGQPLTDVLCRAPPGKRGQIAVPELERTRGKKKITVILLDVS